MGRGSDGIAPHCRHPPRPARAPPVSVAITRGRPARLVVVVGTATAVGKTWATCLLARVARERGVRVAARKPVQSFEAGPTGEPLEPTDAELLAEATGEDPRSVCLRHRWYPVAMAPPMAADALGRPPIALADLQRDMDWQHGVDLGFVETAGGVRSPIAHDADNAALARLLEPDTTILVADAGLGTINATRLAAEALRPLDVVVLMNRYDATRELHVRNRRWLEEHDGYRIFIDPLHLPIGI